jgi:8-oxo-dGTP pyrophosphatase MutT (NUDIX family)
MNIKLQKNLLLEFFAQYQPFDEYEQEMMADAQDFLEAQENPFDPKLQVGHFTASSILLSQDNTQILLHHHLKLDRWLQFGGHIEPDIDLSVSHAALRELMEETGISVVALSVLTGEPIDLDVHLIPERDGFPAHPHYDLRYVFRMTMPPRLPEEGFKWYSVEELCSWEEGSIRRFARKVALMLQQETKNQ